MLHTCHLPTSLGRVSLRQTATLNWSAWLLLFHFGYVLYVWVQVLAQIGYANMFCPSAPYHSVLGKQDALSLIRNKPCWFFSRRYHAQEACRGRCSECHLEVGSRGLRSHDLVRQVHDNFDELLEAEHQPAEKRPLGYRPWAGFTLPWFYLPEVKQLPILKAKKVSGKVRRKLTLL